MDKRELERTSAEFYVKNLEVMQGLERRDSLMTAMEGRQDIT